MAFSWGFVLVKALELPAATIAGWRLAIGALALSFALLVRGPASRGPLVPALHSYWLVIHVFAAMLAGAAFVIGAIASAAYLLKARKPESFPRLPSATRLDEIAFKVNAFAFPIWTFAALIAGPIWAQYAWGRYWGWDPKETGALVIWITYAIYLHTRVTYGWVGVPSAVIGVIGFFIILAGFLGVNLGWFADGLHSYGSA
jgi:cytochrome c-type biogenesis protein CcsB